MGEEQPGQGPGRGRDRGVARVLVAALDGVVVIYLLVTMAYLVIGPFHLGPLGVHRLSKPLLVLLVASAVRLALPWESALGRFAGRARDQLVGTARAQVQAGPWSAAIFDATVALIITRVISTGIAFLANVILPLEGPRHFLMPFASAKFAETFAAFDSGWYFTIALRGYFFDSHAQSAVAFFPLYPMLMRGVAWPFGGSEYALWVAGITISSVCYLAGLAVLHRLTQAMLGDRETARKAVLYVAVFPFALFFTRVYSESLFLLLTVSAVCVAVRGRFGWAGLLGGLAALTRSNGILIALPLVILAVQDRPSWGVLVRRAVGIAIVPLGLAAFCVFVWTLSGDPLAWLHAQDQWGYSVGNRPWVGVMTVIDSLESQGFYTYFLADRLAPYRFVHGLMALISVALVPSVYRRLGPALGTYAAVSLLVPLTGNALEGIGRYVATFFPFFMLLGAVTSRRVHEALLVTGSLGLAFLVTLFVTQRPIY